MIALVLPFIFHITNNTNFYLIVFTLIGIISFQEWLIPSIDSIPYKAIRYSLSQTIVYIVGYSLFSILGIIVNKCKNIHLIILLVVSAIGCLIYFLQTGNMLPQEDKYPPHALYLLYGWFGCCFMFVIRPWLLWLAKWGFWGYLSKNSMWLYLWHIIPVMCITPQSSRPEFWLERYVLVLAGALLLNLIYQFFINKLPNNFKKYLKS